MNRNPLALRAFLPALSAALTVLSSLANAPAADPSAPPVSPAVSALQPFVDRHALAGAVTLVAWKDGVLDTAAVGWADIAAQRPMRTNDLFWIASMSKAMTAAAVMMLVDEGKVRTDDPVEKYLPEMKALTVAGESNAPPHKPQRAITVHDILSHTSGLPFKSPKEEPTLDGLPLREAVLSYAATPLLFEPGTKYQYSNAGINTAGRIVEVVSGMPYETFMQKRLFDPLGMTDTTFWPTEEQVLRLAKSYKPDAAKSNLVETTIGQLYYPLSDRAKRFPMPAGGLFSTAADTARFCRMLLRHGELDGRRVLSEAAVREMGIRQTPPALKESYGYGLTCGEGHCGHGGAEGTQMNVDWSHGIVTVFMVQHAGFPLDGKDSHEAFRRAALGR